MNRRSLFGKIAATVAAVAVAPTATLAMKPAQVELPDSVTPGDRILADHVNSLVGNLERYGITFASGNYQAFRIEPNTLR